MDIGPIYNTTMALAAGVGLLLLVGLGATLIRGRSIHRGAWAIAFGTVGGLMAFLGAVMTVTWPINPPLEFDNIVFGEPTLIMGALLVAGSFVLGARRFWASQGDELSAIEWPRLTKLLQPLSWFAAAAGLALLAIAAVGPVYGPWEAPPQEPISSEFSATPWIENTFIALLYALTGIGAILTPFALMRESLAKARGLLLAIGGCWLVSGLALTVFGALNFYTHVGLEINLQSEQAAAILTSVHV